MFNRDFFKKKKILDFHVLRLSKLDINQDREDGTIESAVPLPAPFAGGSSGSTFFTPWPIH